MTVERRKKLAEDIFHFTLRLVKDFQLYDYPKYKEIRQARINQFLSNANGAIPMDPEEKEIREEYVKILDKTLY